MQLVHFFIVTGTRKAAALKEVIEGPRNCAKFPAQCIEPSSSPTTLVYKYFSR